MSSIRKVNVCVVGGAGFLGSHLVNHLIEDRECQVLVMDNLCVGRREFIHSRAKFLHCDITQSEEYLTNVFAEEAIRYVFNYAAFPYVPDSFKRPIHVMNVNCFGAMKVINAADAAGVLGTLQVSSAELYGEHRNAAGEEREEHKLGKISEYVPVVPHSSYGASKAAVDYFVQCAWKERRTRCIALRQFNCVGERETHPYVVPEIISQLADDTMWRLEGKPGASSRKVHLGNNSFRDFLYAGDAVKMAVELLEAGTWGEVYNLGSETGIKIYELAEMIGGLMGFNVVVQPDPSRVRPWEIWHLQSDNSKINVAIESRPTVGLEEALLRTIRYYESCGRKWCWE